MVFALTIKIVAPTVADYFFIIASRAATGAPLITRPAATISFYIGDGFVFRFDRAASIDA